MLIEGVKLVFLSMIVFILLVCITYLKDIQFRIQQYENYIFVHIDALNNGIANETVYEVNEKNGI